MQRLTFDVLICPHQDSASTTSAHDIIFIASLLLPIAFSAHHLRHDGGGCFNSRGCDDAKYGDARETRFVDDDIGERKELVGKTSPQHDALILRAFQTRAIGVSSGD